jgi:hypothetical protein
MAKRRRLIFSPLIQTELRRLMTCHGFVTCTRNSLGDPTHCLIDSPPFQDKSMEQICRLPPKQPKHCPYKNTQAWYGVNVRSLDLYKSASKALSRKLFQSGSKFTFFFLTCSIYLSVVLSERTLTQ